LNPALEPTHAKVYVNSFFPSSGGGDRETGDGPGGNDRQHRADFERRADDVPEGAFLYVGGLDEAIAKAKAG
jgi:hypothetical protein